MCSTKEMFSAEKRMTRSCVSRCTTKIKRRFKFEQRFLMPVALCAWEEHHLSDPD